MKTVGTRSRSKPIDGGPDKRVGRPPRVTTDQIAEAALAIGLDHATVRNVAAHLDMSVPGLRYYVRTREELLAMAAAHGLGELPLPIDHGQPWAEWLVDYARFVYDALVAQPELIGQILVGTVNTIRMTQHLEGFFAMLVERGFTVDQAYATYARLTDATVGAASTTIGRAAAVKAGHPLKQDLTLAVKALGPDAVPLVDRLVGVHDLTGDDPFDTVRLVIDTLAATTLKERNR